MKKDMIIFKNTTTKSQNNINKIFFQVLIKLNVCIYNIQVHCIDQLVDTDNRNLVSKVEKGKIFTRFIKQLKGKESMKEKGNQDSIAEVSRKIRAKQTRMETKGK